MNEYPSHLNDDVLSRACDGYALALSRAKDSPTTSGRIAADSAEDNLHSIVVGRKSHRNGHSMNMSAADPGKRFDEFAQVESETVL